MGWILSVYSLGVRAETIDEFSFRQTGWVFADGPFPNGSYFDGKPDPGGTLVGTFAGSVGPNGLISLTNLSAFTAVYSDNTGVLGSLPLAGLTFFSFNPAEPADSLTFAASLFQLTGACTGVASALSPDCTTDFVHTFPLGTNGIIFSESLPFWLTNDLATTEFVSTSVPEPSTWTILLIGFCGAGFMAWRGAGASALSSGIRRRPALPRA